MRMGPIIQQIQVECQGCRGLGVSGTCGGCSRKGWKQVNKFIKLNVSRNIVDGGHMTIKGIGHTNLHSQNIIGDVNIVFKIQPHKVFTKSGNDLKMTSQMSWKDSVCGGIVTVPHFGGEFVVDTFQFGVVKPDSEHIVKGKGFTTEGDLFIKFKIDRYPVLTSEQVQKIKEII